jgi:hypothetical protein
MSGASEYSNSLEAYCSNCGILCFLTVPPALGWYLKLGHSHLFLYPFEFSIH